MSFYGCTVAAASKAVQLAKRHFSWRGGGGEREAGTDDG